MSAAIQYLQEVEWGTVYEILKPTTNCTSQNLYSELTKEIIFDLLKKKNNNFTVRLENKYLKFLEAEKINVKN